MPIVELLAVCTMEGFSALRYVGNVLESKCDKLETIAIWAPESNNFFNTSYFVCNAKIAPIMAIMRSLFFSVESEAEGHSGADRLGGGDIGAWEVAPNDFAIWYSSFH